MKKKYAKSDEALVKCFSAFSQQPKVPRPLRAQIGHLKPRQRCITSYPYLGQQVDVRVIFNASHTVKSIP